MKQLIKHLFGQAIYTTGLNKMLWKNKALIVTFHAVNDMVSRNPVVSCTKSQFSQYCDFFKKYFDVISLSSLHNHLTQGGDISGKLVITFDDGYKDNYTTAAPILVEKNLPACFFIVTNFIGSNHQAWWDDELGFSSEWMTWDNIRELKSQGFEIGSHTKNHNDLNFLNKQQAKNEVLDSIAKIQQETGEKPDFFANPYGRSSTITQSIRVIIQDNFKINVGSTGKLIRQSSDFYCLERNNVTPWYHSPFAFGFQMLLDQGIDLGTRPVKGNYINELSE